MPGTGLGTARPSGIATECGSERTATATAGRPAAGRGSTPPPSSRQSADAGRMRARRPLRRAWRAFVALPGRVDPSDGEAAVLRERLRARGSRQTESRPIFYSLPRRRCYARHGVDRPASRHAGLHSRFHVPSAQHGSAAMLKPMIDIPLASLRCPPEALPGRPETADTVAAA